MTKRGEKQAKPMVADFFWYDWMLAVAALKGEIQLTEETLERWKKEVADYYDRQEAQETD